MARVSLLSGHIERARSDYEQLAREEPGNPDYPAELGSIALRTGEKGDALKYWEAALSNGTYDADLCYRYALLVEESSPAKQKAALERAVALKPGFDDALYKLALVQMQAGEYGPAAEHLNQMQVPSGSRRFAYWIALATALTEVDRRDEAIHAAKEAQQAAENETGRQTAQRLGYAAATDLTVQLETDSQGQTHMVTTRVPHGTKDWNPFIQPSDRIVRATGELSEVLCAAGVLTGFKLKTASGPVTVAVPDPTHVLMKNSPSEFYCGPVAQKAVVADFAVVKSAGLSTNLLRGMIFQ
jgi:tetratricopeptide (TPR) repeat protein